MDPALLAQAFPAMPDGRSWAVDDISIANGMSIGPAVRSSLFPVPGEPLDRRFGPPFPTIAHLDVILQS